MGGSQERLLPWPFGPGALLAKLRVALVGVGLAYEDDGGNRQVRGVPALLALPGNSSVLLGKPLPPACDCHTTQARMSRTRSSTALPRHRHRVSLPPGPEGRQPLQRALHLNYY